MNEITLIFPNQLFQKHPALDRQRPVYLVEEYLFFRVQPFHKQRLVLLRAAMKSYASFLRKKEFKVIYVESAQLKKRGSVFTYLAQKGCKKIHVTECNDDYLQSDLSQSGEKHAWDVCIYSTPMFLCPEEELRGFFGTKKRLTMASFYAYQRKKLSILIKQGKPVGGKLSFDVDNRKRIPKNTVIPQRGIPKIDPEVEEAVEYVCKNFPKAIGEAKPFLYPTTFAGAKKALREFIKDRFALFGDYEDAIVAEQSFLFHSVLSPLLNIGILTPQEVVDEVLAAHVPLNSLEGFIRQIIGWREFVRAAYLLKGRRQRKANALKHTSSLPKGFWDGTTGILPVDNTIQKVLLTGYCHHIERLMVLGNFLLLNETDPDEVYTWFMAYFIDAYDWVMVPNVYGMSQYADEGTMTTKPYIASSNYLLKMSDYPKGEWTDIWDGLFWRFVQKHKDLLQRNPRTKTLVTLASKNAVKLQPKIAKAKKWLRDHQKTDPKQAL